LRFDFQNGARVLVADADPAVGKHAIVLHREELRGMQHRLAILGYRQTVDRIAKTRPCRNAAAHAEAENVLAVRFDHQRQLSQQDLGREVSDRGGVSLPIDP
jgi:hypothetical protein